MHHEHSHLHLVKRVPIHAHVHVHAHAHACPHEHSHRMYTRQYAASAEHNVPGCTPSSCETSGRPKLCAPDAQVDDFALAQRTPLPECVAGVEGDKVCWPDPIVEFHAAISLSP